jgi:hypothetical protein
VQIGNNTTGLAAALTVATDKDGRDWCVVVVKGTFTVARDGTAKPADEQFPPVTTDEYYGDPAASSIRYECDFARFKPRADSILIGRAVPPGGRPVPELDVSLEVGSNKKTVHVTGDRMWEHRVGGMWATDPKSFESMPLVYERSFGGSDYSDPRRAGSELRNLIGVGFYTNPDSGFLSGKPLPNLEDPRHRLRSWSDTPPPAGFGVIGRGWRPRVTFAGTYDQRWRDERFPYLPNDFDERYYQSAPADQQVPHLVGGERVLCTNVRADGPFVAVVPTADVPLTFRFRDRDHAIEPRLDTLIIEPDARRLIAVWRGQVALGRKLTALREVLIGPQPVSRPVVRADGKRHYGSLAEVAAALRRGDL